MPFDIQWEGETYEVCSEKVSQWVLNIGFNLYYNSHLLFRVIFIHSIPCILLIMFNTLLIRTLNEAKRTREEMFNMRFNEHRTTTLILIAVVTVFLLTEVPMAVLLTLFTISDFFDDFDYQAFSFVTLLANFSITVSFPLNFAIYCCMSKQFRMTLITVLCGKSSQQQVSHLVTSRTQRTDAF